MAITITPSGQASGATVRGVDLTQSLHPDTVATIRAAWLEHHVLAFPDQPMSDDDLERFTLAFGPFGHDPFLESLEGHEHIVALHRAADETASVFADAWHADWSFQEHPPAGTCLLGLVIPPDGGDTLFADQEAAVAAIPGDLRTRIAGKRAIHSAGVAYGPDGIYGTADQESVRSMDIIISEDANASRTHPLTCTHPETGRQAIYGCLGYIYGIEGMDADEARDLLLELYQWQTQPRFQYRHEWEPDMFVFWDNRSVLHMATGGYDGHERLLHRTTIGSGPPEQRR